MDKPYIKEPGRQLPVHGSYDVIVAGAGPAGVAAALSAARNGASTCLIEGHGALGGVWTSGLLSWVIDAGGKPGIMREIIDRLDARNARTMRGRNFAYDVEEMKLLLEELTVEAGVHVRLHTRVAAAFREGDRLAAIATESKSGREAFSARVFIDTTGDGDLAAQAGCRFAYGDPLEHRAQPMSLVALLGGVRAGEIAPFVGGGVPEAKVNLLQEFRRAGVVPSYTAPTLFRIRDDFFALMANHEYGVSPMNVDDLTGATLRARAELHRLIHALRRLGGPWAGLRLIATAAQIGIREGRRVRGRYEVTVEDLYSGRHHSDGICRVTAGLDVHSTNPKLGGAYEHRPEQRVKPYEIPLRALIARDVNGLMMAGRCISGDFLAHSSYRMTGNAVAMGEAAGVVAALAARSDRDPHELPWAEVAPYLAAVPEPLPQ